MEIATVEPGRTRIGWIGTGVMGSSMCGHLIDRGFACTVYNRTRDKAAGLLDKGAAWADSPARVAEQSDVIFTIVGFPADVRKVVLGDEGSLAGSKPGTILVDMTTSEPLLAIEIADAARQRGVWSVDAPVSGGDIGAREARLSIMIGGESPAVQALAPCWEAMGKTIVHQGVSGAGQHTKMVNQILIATNMIGVCEALLYAYRAGLDLNTVMQSVASGAAGSWSLSNLGPRIIGNNFAPGFFRRALSERHADRAGRSRPHGPVPARPRAGQATVPGAPSPRPRPRRHPRPATGPRHPLRPRLASQVPNRRPKRKTGRLT
jgi:3-hydroxyisobutyrate dehydrogenase